MIRKPGDDISVNWIDRHAYGFGSAFARLLYPLFPKRRRIAVDNIIKAGITDDRAEADRIAREAWGHLAGHVCEALRVPHVITRDNWREHLDVTSSCHPGVVKALFEDLDQPILLVSSHHGVWEAATNLLSLTRPMIAVARVMNNRIVAGWMKNHHFRGPVTIVDKNRGFTPAIIRQWQEEKSAMTILMDQHTARGMKLQFLGRPAMTFTSATRFAMRYGCPVVVGSFVRTAPFKYRLVGGEPLRYSEEMGKEGFTQLLNDRLGDAIRQYPGQYLWSHRRWR